MLNSIFFVFIAVALLSLSYKKHYQQIKNKELRNKKLFYSLNILCCVISLIITINSYGISLGIAYFISAFSLAIVIIALIFTYAKNLFIPLIIISLFSGIYINFI